MKVFISGPYSKGDKETNVEIAMRIANKLLDHGFAPYCPHLTHYLHSLQERAYLEWILYDLRWLLSCDALLRIPGESQGADIEVTYAKAKGMPVFYNLRDLLNYRNKEE